MKVGIIGGGIIGSICAFYLSQEKNIQVDVYDDDWISGTKAAVGIVCPWVTQRRNKSWYKLVEEGANFYPKLIEDLGTDEFVDYTGALVINQRQHDKLFQLAQERANRNPIMGNVREVGKEEMKGLIPDSLCFEKGIDVPGAFRVEGLKMLQVLRERCPNVNWINQRASINNEKGQLKILSKTYDYIIVAAGGGIPEVLNFDRFMIDFYPQKGMLLEYEYPNNNYRIIMPRSEIDLLFKKDSLVIGASHENEFDDLSFDEGVASALIEKANEFMPIRDNYISTRIGLRGHNSRNIPFYGILREYPCVYVAGALGSSGLSSAPIIAYRLVDSILNGNLLIEKDCDVNQYIKKAAI